MATSGSGFSGRAFEDYLGRFQVVVVRFEEGLVATVPPDDPRLEAALTIVRNSQRRVSELQHWVRKNPSDPSVTVANSLVAESDLVSLTESFLDAIEGLESAQGAVENGEFHITLAVKLFEKLQDDPVVGKKVGFLKVILWNLLELKEDIDGDSETTTGPPKCSDVRSIRDAVFDQRCIDNSMDCEDSQEVKDLADDLAQNISRECGVICKRSTDCREGECCERRGPEPGTTIITVEDDSGCPDLKKINREAAKSLP